MANFQSSYQRLKQWEGGYQAHPSDPGNYNSLGQLVGTNHGISAAVYQDWIGTPPTKAQMQAMPASVAADIYRARFWDKIRGDEIPNQAVADILFDGVVNHGRGVKLAQLVLGVTADNVFGTNTFNALVNFPARDFYLLYKERRRQYYHSLVAADDGLSVFLGGWLNRINSFNDFTGEPGSPGVTKFGSGVWLLLGLLLFLGKKSS